MGGDTGGEAAAPAEILRGSQTQAERPCPLPFHLFQPASSVPYRRYPEPLAKQLCKSYSPASKAVNLRNPQRLVETVRLRLSVEQEVGQGVSLYIPQPAINATVEEDILLSVDYSCHGIPTIEWKYTSSWGVQKIVEWKPGTQANISQSHKDRVCTFDNGSIQLFSVGVRDSGSYIITVTERLGSSQFGTIVLHVSVVMYGCESWTIKKAEC
ncbi:hypothetical protein MJG53_016593 [Ovis ammon polii x Ovis aries]|uniref:Uncharacterized protein n=1 Tax=Ovis ammon polii x Ovis aries TaxID=2918886 RepID=A0ACB9U8L2_9CETA|nr:hypothetical protein MJG53_016593 [Ovis ammon polii x Ovis aries]